MTRNTNTNPETDLQIALDKNTIFKFECYIEEDKIKLNLKQINNDTPYYYQKSFILEEFYLICPAFRSCNSLEKVREILLALLNHRLVSLVSYEDGKKIEMEFTIFNINQKEIFKLMLERNQ